MPGLLFLGSLEWSSWIASFHGLRFQLSQGRSRYRRQLFKFKGVNNWNVSREFSNLPNLKLLKHSLILAPFSVLLLTSLLRRSPVEMNFHWKYSARAIAFSCLALPGAPMKKIRRTKIDKLLELKPNLLVTYFVGIWCIGAGSRVAFQVSRRSVVWGGLRKARRPSFPRGTARLTACSQISEVCPCCRVFVTNLIQSKDYNFRD